MNYMLEEGQSIDDPNTGNNKINKKNDMNSLNKTCKYQPNISNIRV